MSNRKKKKKKLMIAFFLIILLILIALVYFVFFKKDNNDKAVVLKKIDNYGYTLEDRDSKLMVNTFNELEEILQSDKVDYQKYAETLSKLFVIDLFTISNKIDSYDVGSEEYIYPDDVEEYKYNVMGTLYKYIGYKDDRDEKMPEVKSIESIKSKETTFNYNNEDYNAYTIDIKWDYVKDLGYSDEATITVFKVDNKLYIGEFMTSGAQNE